MKAKIETYRGIDIYFETYDEKFICDVSDEIEFKKGSYKLMQNAIDNYLKENQSFKPFKVITNPSARYGGVGYGIKTIIGIRKDGRFMYQNEDGSKKQISDYDEAEVILYEPHMEQQLVEIAYLETLVDDARKKVQEAKLKVKGVYLSEYRKSLNI